MRPAQCRQGFTLPEIVFALGLLLVAVLSAALLGFSTLASNRKATDTQSGALVASQVLDSEIQAAAQDPTSAFWNQNSALTVYETQTVTAGVTPYQARIYVSNVTIAADNTIPGAPATPAPAAQTLKRVDVTVNWWDSQTKNRQGYGQLETRACRMVYGP